MNLVSTFELSETANFVCNSVLMIWFVLHYPAALSKIKESLNISQFVLFGNPCKTYNNNNNNNKNEMTHSAGQADRQLTLYNWATSVAHLTHFRLNFYAVFTEDASRLLLYHDAKSQRSRWPKLKVVGVKRNKASEQKVQLTQICSVFDMGMSRRSPPLIVWFRFPPSTYQHTADSFLSIVRRYTVCVAIHGVYTPRHRWAAPRQGPSRINVCALIHCLALARLRKSTRLEQA